MAIKLLDRIYRVSKTLEACGIHETKDNRFHKQVSENYLLLSYKTFTKFR